MCSLQAQLMANMAMPMEAVAVDYLAYGTTGEDSERLPFLFCIHFAVVLFLLVLPFARLETLC